MSNRTLCSNNLNMILLFDTSQHPFKAWLAVICHTSKTMRNVELERHILRMFTTIYVPGSMQCTTLHYGAKASKWNENVGFCKIFFCENVTKVKIFRCLHNIIRENIFRPIYSRTPPPLYMITARNVKCHILAHTHY